VDSDGLVGHIERLPDLQLRLERELDRIERHLPDDLAGLEIASNFPGHVTHHPA
jgi:hypothetical protein